MKYLGRNFFFATFQRKLDEDFCEFNIIMYTFIDSYLTVTLWRPIQDMHAKGFAVTTLDLPAFGVEMHDQILDLKELSHPPRILGSRRSRRPSPAKLNMSTVTTIAIPGNSNSHHCPVTIKLAPSEIISPHSGLGG